MPLSVEKISFRALGTDIDLRLVISSGFSAGQAQEDLAQARELYARAEKIFSRFDPDSELSRLNGNLGKVSPASAEMVLIAKKSLAYFKATRGYFDPRIIEKLEQIGYDRNFADIQKENYQKKNPVDEIIKTPLEDDLIVSDDAVQFKRRLDFSGIVKGWATDRVAGFFKKQGWKNFLVDSGGDMFFGGSDEEGNPWLVDLEGFPSGKLLLSLSNKAVATSGIARRKWERRGQRVHHLINPHNPADFSFDLKSVTVVAPTVEQADVWAKTLFLLGKSKASAKAEEKQLACVILEYTGAARMSSALHGHIHKTSP